FPLFRRDLPWCGRRTDEVGGELRVARPGILHRLFLHRAVAADAIRQRENFGRGIGGDRRERAWRGRDVLFVARDQVALELAIGGLAEEVERRAAQALHFGENPERGHHPRTKGTLASPAQRVDAACQERRRQVERE